MLGVPATNTCNTETATPSMGWLRLVGSLIIGFIKLLGVAVFQLHSLCEWFFFPFSTGAKLVHESTRTSRRIATPHRPPCPRPVCVSVCICCCVFVCVSMCLCVCVYVCACVFVCACGPALPQVVCVSMCLRVRVCVPLCLYRGVCVCVCVCVSVSVDLHVCVCVCVCVCGPTHHRLVASCGCVPILCVCKSVSL